MRMWIDTEFNDFKGDLISMGIVAEDGNEFYEVLHNTWVIYTPWVEENVVPVLNKDEVSKHTFQSNLAKFIGQYKEIHIIADWPEDLQWFMNMLVTGPGERMNTPKITMELKYDLPSTRNISKIPHNALADAQALMEAQLTREKTNEIRNPE